MDYYGYNDDDLEAPRLGDWVREHIPYYKYYKASPRLQEIYAEIDNPDGGEWVDAILEGSVRESDCNWDQLDGDDWVDLLTEEPRYADHCVWSKLNGENWAELLNKQPQFAERRKP